MEKIKMFFKKRKKLIVVLGIVLVFLGSGGYLLWRINQETTLAPEDTEASGAGGQISTVGEYTVHVFRNSGTFTLSGDSTDIEYLIVGGGGGGGAYRGGGGGAGGVLTDIKEDVAPGTYQVTVGQGGAGGRRQEIDGVWTIFEAGKGGDSSIFDIVAVGGGAAGDGGPNQVVGNTEAGTGTFSPTSGGSGGGGGRNQPGRSGTSGQGHNGSAGATFYHYHAGHGSWHSKGGGGGGAGGPGVSPGPEVTGSNGGRGGPGISSSITGQTVWYGGGGGGFVKTADGGWGTGGGWRPSHPDPAGGGDAAIGATPPGNGIANTGGGGGGGGGQKTSWTGGSGGSGIVVIRYKTVTEPDDDPIPTGTFRVIYNPNITGENAVIDEDLPVGEAYTIKDPTWTNPGYDFDTWTTKSDGGDEYSPGSTLDTTHEDDLELYAQWKAAETEVTLDRQGGTGTPKSVTATYGQTMPEVQDTPKMTGYKFLGYWDQKNGAGTQYYSDRMGSMRTWDKTEKEATLYAHWEIEEYTITYLKNADEQLHKNVVCAFSSVTVEYESAIPEDKAPGCTTSLNVTADDFDLDYLSWQDPQLAERLRPGDLTGNGRIGISDFAIFLGDYNAFRNNDIYNARSDYANPEGKIGIADYSVWLRLWKDYRDARDAFIDDSTISPERYEIEGNESNCGQFNKDTGLCTKVNGEFSVKPIWPERSD